MKKWLKQLFCFHDDWKKKNPEPGGLTKPSNAWIDESYWHCGKCGLERCFSFDHIPLEAK